MRDLLTLDREGPVADGTGPRPSTAKRSRSATSLRRAAGFIPVLLLIAAACWRATLGLDLGDGTHVVGLAMRLAQGDRPLADEMNLQALGSLPAVLPTWLWLHLAGTTGVILFSRLLFVAVAAACAALAWRALQAQFGRAVAAGAVMASVIPAPYNLLAISYNTTPALLLLVSVAAGCAAVRGKSMRWAAVCGASAVLAALSYPVMGVAAGITVVLVPLLSRRRPVVLGCLLGAAGTAGVCLAGVVLWIGADRVQETVVLTNAYQGLRMPFQLRLANNVAFFQHKFSSRSMAAAAVLALLACAPRAPLRLRAAALAGVPLPVAWQAVRIVPDPGSVPRTGMTSGVAGLGLVLLLLLPATVWAVQRTVHRDRVADPSPRGATPPAGLVPLVLGVVPALAQVPVIAALSSSSPAWGAIAVATAPALAAVLLVCGSLLRQASRAIWAVGATALVVVLFATHAIQPYRNAAPWDLTAEAHSGPASGIRTTPDRLAWAAGMQAAVASCQRPGEGLLAYGVPAAYVFANGPMDTNILWLGAFGKANQAGVSWIERTHREPTCVIIATAYLRFAHQTWNAPQGQDPLLRWMSSRYRELDQPGLSYVVLRRLGR